MRPGSSRTYQEGTTTLPTFLQALNASMSQRTAGQSADGQNKANQAPYWAGQRGHTRRTPAQNRAALVGVIIWFIFIIFSMLMSLFRK
jgi:type VI protein secretion system component VasF